MKKLAIAAIAILVSLTSLSSHARTWHRAEVLISGVSGSGGDTFVRLTSLDNETYSFENRLFRIHPANKTVGLAITMAAASSNRQILIESDVDAGPDIATIYSIYLTKDVVSSN